MSGRLFGLGVAMLLVLGGCASEDKRLFDKALGLQAENKFEYAIENYKKIIDEHPSSQYVSNSNVKLNQCIDALVKEGDRLASDKELVKAAYLYEQALGFRPNDLDLKNKLATSKEQLTGATTELTSTKNNQEAAAPEENGAVQAAYAELANYKGKEIGSAATVSRNSIRELIGGWQEAWMSKDIERYGSYYDPGFIGMSGGNIYNHDTWINYKAATFSKYREIFLRTRIEDFEIAGDQLKITIQQEFSGTGPNAYADETKKELTFRSGSTGWTIVGERPI